MYEEFKTHGVTESTPKSLMLGAGTIHKGLVYETATKKWNFAESLICATSGGTKLSIIPEFMTVEVDGVYVEVKGLKYKVGETAKLETNLVEITPETIKTTAFAKDGMSDVEGFDLIESKSTIEDKDYIENLAYVGHTSAGKPIIIIFDLALCTGGFEADNKHKSNTVAKAVFDCLQLVTGDLGKLPYRIYYPKTVQETVQQETVQQETQEESN